MTDAPPTPPERRTWSRVGTLLWVAVLVVLGVLLVVRIVGDRNAPPEQGTAGEDASWQLEREVGTVVRVLDGSVARLNGVELDVEIPPDLPGPEAGMRIDRVDVEVCAGLEDLFVDAAFWLPLGDDDAVGSAHMGVRDLETLTLAPGACQRGLVDLALPEEVGLAGVLLVGTTRTTVASWSVDGAHEAGAVEPLSSGAEPETHPVGTAVEVVTGATATLHGITGDGSVTVDAELCAGAQPELGHPRHWFLQLTDHRMVAADREGATLPAEELGPDACGRGTVAFTLPDGSEAVAVVYATGGAFETARWALGD